MKEIPHLTHLVSSILFPIAETSEDILKELDKNILSSVQSEDQEAG